MAGRLDFPSVVGIETINTCNARCPFCPLFQGEHQIDRSVRPAQIMEMDLFEKIVSDLSNWKENVGTIFMNMNGEPLQDPRFLERVKLLKKYGISNLVEINTNGQYLDQEKSLAILGAGFSRVVLGFDGATKDVYEQNRVRCDYSRVLDNLRQFVALRHEGGFSTKVALQYVRNAINEFEVSDAWRLFSGILDSDMDVFQDDFAKDWSGATESNDYYLIPRLDTPVEIPSCELVNTQLVINSDGKIQACCWDYNLTVSGSAHDVKAYSLLEIWRSPSRAKLAESVNAIGVADRPEKCRHCAYSAPAQDVALPEKKLDEQFLVSETPWGYSYRFPEEQSALR